MSASSAIGLTAQESTRTRTVERSRLAVRALAPLAAILLVASGFRLWGLTSQPVLFFDSGVYLSEGEFFASVTQRAFEALVRPGPGASANPLVRIVDAAQDGASGHPPELAKPGHAALLATSFLLLGTNPFAGVLVSALAGIGTVVVTYLVGLVGWGRRVAIPAALLLAVSAEHVMYSREALVEADGLFFATLGSLVYLRALVRGDPRSRKALFWAGILWGIAFTCNNRLTYLPLVLAAPEFAVWSGDPFDRWRRLGRRVAAIGLGFLTPILAFELAYLVVRRVGRFYGATTPWMDYFEQLIAFGKMNRPRLRWDQWPTFWTDAVLMEGAILVLLFAIGVWLALRHRTSADLLLLGSLVVPIAFYSVYSTGEVRMRHFSLALPWIALAAAIAVRGLADLMHRRAPRLPGAVAATALVGASLALTLPRSVELAQPLSAEPGFAAFVNGHGIQRVASTNGPVIGFLLGEDRSNARFVESFVSDANDLHSLETSGYTHFATEMQMYVIPLGLNEFQRFEQVDPVFAAPNGNDAWFLGDILEHNGVGWGDWNRILQHYERFREPATQVRLYAFDDLFPPRRG